MHRYDVEAGEVQTIESEDPTGKLIEPIDPATGQKLPARPLMPDPGFNRNPAKQAWQPDLSRYPAKLTTQYIADQASP